MTPYLHGNGTTCSSCGGVHKVWHKGACLMPAAPCRECKNTGRVALPLAEVVAATVEQARAGYWMEWGVR